MSWPEEHTFKYRMCIFAAILHGTHCFRQRSPSCSAHTAFDQAHTLWVLSDPWGSFHLSLEQRPCPHNSWVPRKSPRPRDPLDAHDESRRGWHRSRYAPLTFIGACPHSALHTDDLMSDMIYHPPLLLANGRHGPSTLQATLTIPAKSTLRLSIDLSKAFLKYTEHPPDAMRGWDLPPAVLFPVTLRDGARTNGSLDGRSIPKRMYTPTLLVDLPTPDFSMPYNVIILSCTLMTLIFGSIFNLLTRKWIIVKLDD
jgi:hypothetical protein